MLIHLDRFWFWVNFINCRNIHMIKTGAKIARLSPCLQRRWKNWCANEAGITWHWALWVSPKLAVGIEAHDFLNVAFIGDFSHFSVSQARNQSHHISYLPFFLACVTTKLVFTVLLGEPSRSDGLKIKWTLNQWLQMTQQSQSPRSNSSSLHSQTWWLDKTVREPEGVWNVQSAAPPMFSSDAWLRHGRSWFEEKNEPGPIPAGDASDRRPFPTGIAAVRWSEIQKARRPKEAMIVEGQTQNWHPWTSMIWNNDQSRSLSKELVWICGLQYINHIMLWIPWWLYLFILEYQFCIYNMLRFDWLVWASARKVRGRTMVCQTTSHFVGGLTI